MKNRNFIISILALIIAATIGFVSYFSTQSENASKIKMAAFPKIIGNWKSVDLSISENDYKILETRNLIMREYTNSQGDAITLYIVYSENNRKVVHPPELCLTGGGQSIEYRDSIKIGNIQAVKLLMEKEDFRQLVLYWFKAGNLNTDRYVKQQLKVVLDLLRGRRTSSALIRITTSVKNGDNQAALALLKGFVLEIENLLPEER
ncbi:MAG: EpsI family protein [Candidatus Omnitrophica bacterium]|nr:EpsI family protein [Candidatus Omnitrophota bacterium]